MSKIILGLVGEIGSGKDTVADYLKMHHGAGVARFSTSMTDCLHRLNVPATRENLVTFSEITRHAYGEDLYARIIAHDCKESPADIVVANGIRRAVDCVHMRQLPGFRLVYVTAPERIRFERIRNRGEKENEKDMTWEEFQANAQLPTEVTIRGIAAEADVTLNNAGDRESLYEQIEKIILP